MKKSALVLLLSLLVAGSLFCQVDVLDNLVAYYKFDEVGEPAVADHSGNYHIGEIVGDPIYSEGVVGTCLYFDGVDDYVNCYNDAMFNMDREITITMWVRSLDNFEGFTGDAGHNPWISKGDHQWALKGRLNDDVEFFVYTGGWNTVQVVLDSAEFNDKWHHFAGTFDGDSAKVYIDGVLDSTNVFNGLGPMSSSDYDVCLAHNSEQDLRYFNGYLDEVRVYNVELSATDIKNVYEASLTAVDEKDAPMAADFILHQNYPNPFNPATRISYDLKNPREVTVKVYDVTGAEVRTLVNGMQSEGNHSVLFDAGGLASGVYYYKLVAGTETIETKKMVLMK
ncbi:T9SS type A sorting domain-containing protein [bacterium]|nr:T9SS type A sorting domain-containing protein [bacterium]